MDLTDFGVLSSDRTIIEHYRAPDYPVREAFTFGANQHQQYFTYAYTRWIIARRGDGYK